MEIERAVVYCTWAAQAFSAGIKCQHCTHYIIRHVDLDNSGNRKGTTLLLIKNSTFPLWVGGALSSDLHVAVTSFITLSLSAAYTK